MDGAGWHRATAHGARCLNIAEKTAQKQSRWIDFGQRLSYFLSVNINHRRVSASRSRIEFNQRSFVAGADSITIPYLLWVLLFFPVMGVISYYRLKSGRPLPRKPRRYGAMIAMQLLLLAYTLLLAQKNQVDLFGKHWPSFWSWILAAAYLAFIGVRLNAAWRRLKPERKQRARVLLPENPPEMFYWVPISFLAGLSEETAFRGMVYVALIEMTGSAGFAVTVCVLAFALAHMLQGWRGVLGAGVIGLVMHAVVYMTQGLYLAIAIHAAYDVVVGTIAMKHFQRDRQISAIEPQPAS